MAQNRSLNFAAVFVSNTAANLYNCTFTTVTGGVGNPQVQPYTLLRHIRITNNSTSAATLTLYKSTTGDHTAGKEFAFAGASCPANGAIDWYAGGPGARFDSADYLVGSASAASALTINLEGEVGLSG